MSTNAGESCRSSDHNFQQVILTCWHRTALMLMPTSHVSRTVSHCILRVHRRAGRPGCWIAVVKHEGHINAGAPSGHNTRPQGATPQSHISAGPPGHSQVAVAFCAGARGRHDVLGSTHEQRSHGDFK